VVVLPEFPTSASHKPFLSHILPTLLNQITLYSKASELRLRNEVILHHELLSIDKFKNLRRFFTFLFSLLRI
jgi:hypothetical protein